MAHNTGHTGSHQTAQHVAEWLDGKLFRIMGPPPLGPYGVDDAHAGEHTSCPFCGRAMALHTVEREGAHTFLHCPDPAVTEIAETGRAA